MAEFKKELDLRESGEVDAYAGTNILKSDTSKNSTNWVIIDGTGKNCAGIIAALSEQISEDAKSIVEVIIPDVLNTYDLILWTEKNSHSILTQRKDQEGSLRMLIQP